MNKVTVHNLKHLEYICRSTETDTTDSITVLTVKAKPGGHEVILKNEPSEYETFSQKLSEFLGVKHPVEQSPPCNKHNSSFVQMTSKSKLGSSCNDFGQRMQY